MEVTKEIVLEIVKRLGRATSKEVASELFRRGFRCSRKAVSMRLRRYYKQGLLGRARWGRSGFVYRITYKGENRLRYLEEHRGKSKRTVAPNWTQPASKHFFDKQFEELALDFALARSVSSPVCPTEAENQDLLNIRVFKPNSEVNLFYLYTKECDRRVQYEEALKVLMQGNRELRKIIVDYLLKNASSVYFQLGRSIGRFEARGEILRERTQHVSRILRSFHEKKGAPNTGFWKQDAQFSRKILKNTEAHPQSFLIAFPVPSSRTLKIMREGAKGAHTPTPSKMKAVTGQTCQDENEWVDANSWWRHL